MRDFREMEVLVGILFVISSLSTGLAVSNSYDENDVGSCYDCQYARRGMTKNDYGKWVVNTYSGFHRCALEKYEDQQYVNKPTCEGKKCFIRKEPNGQIFRGCADPWNLPWKTNTTLNCARQGYSEALWWFCDGNLCNDGKLEDESRCGKEIDREEDDRARRGSVYEEQERNRAERRDYTSYNKSPALDDGNSPDNRDTPPSPAAAPDDYLPSNIPPIDYNVEEETVHGFGFNGDINNFNKDASYAYTQYTYEQDDEDEDAIIQDDKNNQKSAEANYFHNDHLHGNHPHFNSQSGTHNYIRRDGERVRDRTTKQYGANSAGYPYNGNSASQSYNGYPYGYYGFPYNYNWGWWWNPKGIPYNNAGYGRYSYSSGKDINDKESGSNYRSTSYNTKNTQHSSKYTPIESDTYYSEYSRPKSYHAATSTVTTASNRASERVNSQNDNSEKPVDNSRNYFDRNNDPLAGGRSDKIHSEHFKLHYRENDGGNSNVKLKIIPVQEDQMKVVVRDHPGQERRKEQNQYLAPPRIPHGQDRNQGTPEYNPCKKMQWCTGATITADPKRKNGYIQCGPGANCKCCKPYYHKCAPGTTFDDMHTVCNRGGSSNDESVEYQSVDEDFDDRNKW